MSYGLIELGGKRYMERFTVFPVTITLAGGAILTNQRVVMTGEADFLLKYLTRDFAGAAGAFKFKLFNSDGDSYCRQAAAPANAGVYAGTTDRVRDTLLFGNGSLPFPVIPYILFSKTGAISFDIEETGGGGCTVDMAFHGSLLFPVD